MRKTKNDLKKLQVSGFYRDIDLDDPQPFHTDIEERKAEEGGYSITDDDRYAVYEIHADLVIDELDEAEDEIARPYIVTIERGTSEVLLFGGIGTPMIRLCSSGSISCIMYMCRDLASTVSGLSILLVVMHERVLLLFANS